MKYIIIDGITPILFPNWVSHDSVKIDKPITSAGFFSYENGKVECYGWSNSLNLKPEEDDEFLIKNIFYKEEK